MIECVEKVAGRVLAKNNCILLESDGEADHVHFAIDLHPSCAPSKIVGSVKSASSRILRKEFEPQLRKYFKNWDKGVWGDQKYYASAGGAPIETLIDYIQDHNRGSGHTKKKQDRSLSVAAIQTRLKEDGDNRVQF